jgi:hypothetical protein
MKFLFTITLYLLIIGVTYTQTGVFSKVFSNFPSNPENGWEIIEVTDGYLLVSVIDCLDSTTNSCCCLSKIGKDGDVIWFKYFDFWPNTNSGILIHNENIYIAGTSIADDYQIILKCLDLDGGEIWSKKYGNPNKKDVFRKLLLVNGENILLCSNQDRNIDNKPMPIVLFSKIDENGNIIAEYSFGEQFDSTLPTDIILNTKGDVIISYVYGPEVWDFDLKAGMAKMDNFGEIAIIADYPYIFLPDHCLVDQTDSSTLVTSWRFDTIVPNYDESPPTLFFSDLNGQSKGKLVFMNQTLKHIYNIESLWDKGLIGCGYLFYNYINQTNAPLVGWVFRMNKNHEIEWEKTYTDTTYEGDSFGLQHITPTSDGGFIATGTISNNMTGVFESHNWILKLDSIGCLLPDCGELNYITKTQELVFLKGVNIKIYPNPTSNYLNIQFPEDFQMENLKMTLISNSGIKLFSQPILSSNNYIQLCDYSLGIYYALISRGNEIITTQKFIIN